MCLFVCASVYVCVCGNCPTLHSMWGLLNFKVSPSKFLSAFTQMTRVYVSQSTHAHTNKNAYLSLPLGMLSEPDMLWNEVLLRKARAHPNFISSLHS